MKQSILAVVFFLFAASAASAQEPSDTPEVPLSAPAHWEIHDQNGPIGVNLYVLASYEGVHVFMFAGEIRGQEIWGEGVASHQSGGGYSVWSSDSGNETQWVWDGDHYDKVGGTSAIREFHPVWF